MIAISIMMPTYNTSFFLLEGVFDCILNQISPCFGLVIVDGLVVDSSSYTNSFSDSRIRIILSVISNRLTKSEKDFFHRLCCFERYQSFDDSESVKKELFYGKLFARLNSVVVR